MPSDEPVRINLGAGKQHHEGWIAYDRSRAALIVRSRVLSKLAGLAMRIAGSNGNVRAWPPDTRIHDVVKGIPHATASVDAVYSSHMLEHLPPEGARRVLAECYRVLKPRGTLRLVVPDLEVLVHAYLADDRSVLPAAEPTAADAFIEGLGLRSHSHAGTVLARAARRVLRSDDGGHRWVYDGPSVMQRVREAGFVDVERVGAGEGRDREVAALDHRSPFHVHVEAFKPAG